MIVEAQRRTLLPFRGVSGKHRDNVIHAPRDPTAEFPALKRGAMALVMMTVDNASVRVPLSPYPTSIRTFRSFGEAKNTKCQQADK